MTEEDDENYHSGWFVSQLKFKWDMSWL